MAMAMNLMAMEGVVAMVTEMEDYMAMAMVTAIEGLTAMEG